MIVKIKVGYLLSYDYSMIFTSIKCLYNEVDKIYIAIDKDLKTWSGNRFEIPNSFFEDLNRFDIKNKIEYYFDTFYVANLSPIDCETRERNMLLKKMGSGWKIQIDVDEYIYDFPKIAKYLKKYWYLTLKPKLTPIVLRGKLVTLVRELPEGFLYVENNESFPFLTNQSNYIFTRNNNTVRNHFSNINVIHQSWARNEEEIKMKIDNWGHRDDFDTQSYFEFWKSLNTNNFKEFKNIHPLSPTVWNELKLFSSLSIEDFINKYSIDNKQELNPLPVIKIFKSAIKKLIGKE